MEGDYVLMHWGGGRYKIHKVTFHQEDNVITWLLGMPDSKHIYNRWTGKDIRVIPARKGAALWRKREDVSERLKPLGQHPMDKMICDVAERAALEAFKAFLLTHQPNSNTLNP